MRRHPTYETYARYAVADYLADECFLEWVKHNPAELQAFWRQFLQLHPEKESEVQAARDMITKLRFLEQSPSDEQIERLWQHIEAGTDTPARKVTKQRRLYWQHTRMWAAAVILFLLSFGIWWWFGDRHTTIRTADALRRQVTLPDASVITLNANSVLRYPTHFRGSTREVWIAGEAFFDITRQITDKDQHLQPFIVHTPTLDVIVTGTSFNVHTRRQTAQVVLNSGRITVRYKDAVYPEQRLLPGQAITYIDGQAPQLLAADTSRASSWKKGKFTFTDTPLREVIQQIEDYYGYRVILKDSTMNSYLINAALDIPDISTLEAVLSDVLHVDVKKQDHTLIFSDHP
ncbi:FecR domain-containing protein [Chitinophaga pendula]|uniref:FecR family protein n=1 Tax=Chitinophaga TaxID=79328 RepID=UPI0018E06442|nr:MULTISPECIES: FecR domain-containing protein [Chitinophaga]UCJ07350.1 FecR domain-containing protein [Chitinophaga pendula]